VRARLRLSLTLLALVPRALIAQVTAERLRHAEREPQNWLTYSGSYDSHRYSPLRQISPLNVGRLRPAWVYQMARPRVETSPVVVDGVMYVTEPPSTVTALDARTGRRLWRWEPTLPRELRTIGFGSVNRGVAVLDSNVYVGTIDAHLVALDARSGSVRWNVEVAENRTGHAITSAPLAIAGKVIIGISGGEAGIRGFVDAYDAETGRRVWRFWTIPGPGEPGNETWAGGSWRTGGGPTWLTGSYDPALNLLYWGVGNPGPDHDGDARAGDNLYTCSLVALDAETGRLRWHFQFTPHDTHDWDANQIPILVDAPIAGRARRLVVTANKNAFYYVLDRETGEFLQGAQYARQTWADGLDKRGRARTRLGTEPSIEGTLVYPFAQGATNWFSPAYNPVTRLFYVAVRETGGYYYKSAVEYTSGEPFFGGGGRGLPTDSDWGAIRALDVLTGGKRWEFRLNSPPWAGLLATAGGLVFGGTNEGNIFALDARTGMPLWDFQAGGGVYANPVSYELDSRQYVAVAAGRALFAFALP